MIEIIAEAMLILKQIGSLQMKIKPEKGNASKWNCSLDYYVHAYEGQMVLTPKTCDII